MGINGCSYYILCIIYCVFLIFRFTSKMNVIYSAISSKCLNSRQNYSITISNKIIEISNEKNDLNSGVTNRELGCCFFNASTQIMLFLDINHLPPAPPPSIRIYIHNY